MAGMALFEITVVKPNGETETRYTDEPPVIGGTVTIGGRRGQIVSCHDDVLSSNAVERFVCRVITTPLSVNPHDLDLGPSRRDAFTPR